MATTYSNNQFRSGLKVLLDGDPCVMIEVEFVKPGKGQAFTRVKYRNLKTGRVLEKTFKSQEGAEGADIVDTDMQYLYNDGEFWHFMDPNSYEQYQADKAAMAEASKWLKEEAECSVTLYNNGIILVTAADVRRAQGRGDRARHPRRYGGFGRQDRHARDRDRRARSSLY